MRLRRGFLLVLTLPWAAGCGGGGGAEGEAEAEAEAESESEAEAEAEAESEPEATCPDACGATPDCWHFSAADCEAACAEAGVPATAACLAGDDACASLRGCLGLPEAGAPFSDEPSGTDLGDRAGDFTVETSEGPWTLSEHWRGNESFFFLLTVPDYGYPEALWGSSVDAFLEEAPPATHLFFLHYGDAEAVADMEARVGDALSRLDGAARARWRGRFHFVPGGIETLDGWLGRYYRRPEGVAFVMAIDPEQRLRGTGMLSYFDRPPTLARLAYEVRYLDFTGARARRLAADGATVVPVFERQRVGHLTTTVEFPDAGTMAEFDTMEIDLALECQAEGDPGAPGGCPEWDYLAHLSRCDPLADGDPPDAPCTGEMEIGRWVTTYSRTGRWVTDASSLLAHFAGGGRQRLKFGSDNVYDGTLAIRLLRRGKGARPSEIRFLFGGGPYGPGYNDRPPIRFEVPADVRRVELYALVTGHGWGVEVENCAEFCPHTHHYTVNGVEFVKEHPEAGTDDGCERQIELGVVPNQFGTWPLGRGGWCPGLDVKPFVADLTDAVVLGGDNEITYRSLLYGEDYVPRANPNPPGGFNARIDQGSFLIFWR